METRFPKGWRMVQLGDVTTIVSGSTPDSKQPRYWDGNINWITPAEIHDDSRIIKETERKITQEGFDNSSTQMFPAGTIVLTTRAPIGKVAIAGVDMCSNQGCKNLVPANKILNGKFLFYQLKNNTDYLNFRGSGATFKELSATTLGNIQISLPPLPTQRKIVEILDQADALRRKRKEANEKMKQLIPAPFIKMFGDPATNPMGWEVKRLGNLLQLNDSGVWGAELAGEGDIEVLRSTNITEYGEWKFDDVAKRHIPEEQINKYLLLEGDILITKSSGSAKHIGKMALAGEAVASRRAVFANFMQRLRADRTLLHPVFLYFFLNQPTLREKLQKASSTTSGLKNMKPSAFNALPIPLPPVSLQKEFSETIRGIENQKRAQAKAQQKLDLLFKSLMHRAFRGELL